MYLIVGQDDANVADGRALPAWRVA